MKSLIIFLCCAALGIVAVHADEFHLVETTVQDETPANTPIYVLLVPNHISGPAGGVVISPVVMRKFDGQKIGQIISDAVARGLLPKGSVLHIDPSPVMNGPTEVEIKALRDACEK